MDSLLVLCARSQGALAFLINCSCILAMIDCAEFAIRGFFLSVIFLIIKSMIEVNFLSKFYFLLSPFLANSAWNKGACSGCFPTVYLHLEIPHHKALLRFASFSRPLLTTHHSFTSALFLLLFLDV